MTHASKPAVSEFESEIFNGSTVGTGKGCERVIFLIV